MMAYKRLIIGDVNIVRSWQAAQSARPQLLGVPLRSVTCMDTLDSALSSVTDEYDLVLLSIATGFLIDDGSASDVKASCANVLDDLSRRVAAAAKRAPRAQV